MIRLTNGILFESGEVKFRFDPRRVTEDDVCMISHAHSDHLPSSFRSSKVVCSEITKDFVKARKGKDVDIVRREDVELLDAGHIPGSNMFLVRGDKRVLYTGGSVAELRRRKSLIQSQPNEDGQSVPDPCTVFRSVSYRIFSDPPVRVLITREDRLQRMLVLWSGQRGRSFFQGIWRSLRMPSERPRGRRGLPMRA